MGVWNWIGPDEAHLWSEQLMQGADPILGLMQHMYDIPLGEGAQLLAGQELLQLPRQEQRAILRGKARLQVQPVEGL